MLSSNHIFLIKLVLLYAMLMLASNNVSMSEKYPMGTRLPLLPRPYVFGLQFRYAPNNSLLFHRNRIFAKTQILGQKLPKTGFFWSKYSFLSHCCCIIFMLRNTYIFELGLLKKCFKTS